MHQQKVKLDKAKNLVVLAKQYKNMLDKPSPYNLFSVLRSKSDEVRLHSRFLADLLNPKGQHGLKEQPLKLFLRNVLQISVVDEDYSFEAFVEYKNIDIFLFNRKTKQAIVIENKIYAVDQNQQLLRYYLTTRNEGFKTISILYLTLFGSDPHNSSIQGELGSLMQLDQSYKTASYCEDIKKWISELIEKSAQHPSLRESLIQYLHILRDLTGMSNNYEYIRELKKLLLETNSIDVVSSLYEAQNELRIDAQVALWKKLTSKIRHEYGEFTQHSLKDDESNIRESTTKYLASRRGCNQLQVAVPLKNLEDCYLCVQTEWQDALFIGVINDPSKPNARLRRLTVMEGYQGDSNWWPVYKYLDFDGQWALRNLTSEQVKKLYDEEYVEEFSNHIVNELKKLKDAVESKLDK